MIIPADQTYDKYGSPENLLEALKASQVSDVAKKKMLVDAVRRQRELGVSRPIAGLIDIVSGGQTKLEASLPTEAESAKDVATAGALQEDPFKRAMELEKLEVEKQKIKNAKFKASQGQELNPTQRRLLDKDFKDTLNKTVEPKQRLLALTLKNVKDALDSNSLPRITAILGQIAKGISGEGARLTDQDIARVFPSNFNVTVAKIKAYFKDNPNEVELPSEFGNYVRDSINTAQSNSKKFFENIVESEGRKLMSLKSFSPLKNDNTGNEFVNEFKNQIEGIFVMEPEAKTDRVSKLRGLLNAK